MRRDRNEIDPDQFTLLHGKESYGVDVPDGDMDIHCRWYSDEPCVVWLNFDELGEKSIPVLSGCSGNTVVRAKKVVSVEITCSKKATVCAGISYRSLNREDPLDFTPVEIAPPPPATIQMSHVINQAVMRQLQSMGIDAHQHLEISDEDDLEEDDDGDEFGPGYMEDEPNLDEAEAATAAKPAGSGTVPSPEGQGSPATGVAPDPVGGEPPAANEPPAAPKRGK